MSDAPAGSVSDSDRHPAAIFTKAGRSGTDRVESLHSTSLVPSFSQNLSSDLADIKRAEQDGTFFLVLVYAEMLTEGRFPLHGYPTIPC